MTYGKPAFNYDPRRDWELTVACPMCGSDVGVRCVTTPGRHVLSYAHSARYNCAPKPDLRTTLECDSRTHGAHSAHKDQTVGGPYTAQLHAPYIAITAVKLRTGGQVTVAMIPYREGDDPMYHMPLEQAMAFADVVCGQLNAMNLKVKDRR